MSWESDEEHGGRFFSIEELTHHLCNSQRLSGRSIARPFLCDNDRTSNDWSDNEQTIYNRELMIPTPAAQLENTRRCIGEFVQLTDDRPAFTLSEELAIDSGDLTTLSEELAIDKNEST